MPEGSYYDPLQVQPTADWEIIEVAYRRLIRRYHPDVNRNPESREITTQLNLAREILSDPGKRAVYKLK